MATDSLIFFCNGQKIVDDGNIDPETTLLAYLRKKLRLTGTKLGCAEGGCGACTVMVSSFDRAADTIRHVAVNACLTPICSVHGKAVTTVEGIGSTKSKLHPVQERLAASHGSQCGFCTPGIVMSMYTLLRNNEEPDMEDIFNAFEGNLCRCTGYRPILEGYRTFTKGCGAVNCCQNGPANLTNGDSEHGLSMPLFAAAKFDKYDSSQEPIFPPELLLDGRQATPRSLVFAGARVQWFRPASLPELLEIKSRHPDAKIVAGNTEIGVEVKFKDQLYPFLVDVSEIPELHVTRITNDGVSVGSSVSLSRFGLFLKDTIEQKPEFRTRGYAAFVEMLRWFAGPQIRNVASLGGNIATGSPISDLVPLLMSCNSSLKLMSGEGSRIVPVDEHFYTGYRKTAIKPGELISEIFIPFTAKNEFVFGFKQSPRREDDIAIVNAGMRVLFSDGGDTVEDISLAFGGMAPTTVLAEKTMAALMGKRWNESLLEGATSSLQKELSLPPGVPGGMEVYRQSLVLSFFFKFYLMVLEELNKQDIGVDVPEVHPSFKSAISGHQPKTFKSTQLFQEVSASQPDHDAVGRPIPHKSALQQTTGEAKFIDDLPRLEGELYCGFVFSQKSHAKIISISTSQALSLPGVESVVTADDVPGINSCGFKNEELLFCVDEVTSVGQIIAVVVSESQELARRAAKLVTVVYEELESILTIEEAIEHSSFLEPARTIDAGDLEAGFEASDQILEGECRVGAQEHFYLETNSSVIIPKGEDSEMEIISSTQCVRASQELAANALGVHKNRIVCRTKRLGGGFGGKEFRCAFYSAAAAVAAHKVGRPVRYMLDRDEDMISTGTRHPFLGRYRVGFTGEGRVLALDLKLYSNCGYSYDLSAPVMDRAVFSCDNAYKVPNLRVTGRMCKTNLPSSTAFRGFGGPQSMLIAEYWMNDVATKLKLPHEKVRELNFYQKDDLTHFRQPVTDWNLRRCWESCLNKSNFGERKSNIADFNSQNRWKKKGLAAIPTKFGISFTAKFFNQGAALVLIYNDGSVLVTHGGIEMGQGLHTKMIQVASRALRIPKELIHLSETSSDKVPNSSPTAASTGSDLNGMAVQNACETLVQRLTKYVTADPKGGWKAWVSAAYMDRVSLSATGFYKTPISGYDWDHQTSGETKVFNYFCYGAAVSEVEIDCLTGDHEVIRSDIVMDVGDSLNPAVDIGQIEGAFIQGYGLFVLEDYRYSPSGHLLTKGPGLYKIPGCADIPGEFNVSLLDRAPNQDAICSSKAVGEPPLFLAASVFFAIKDAISSARADTGLTGTFTLDSPACAERIRLACQDQFTGKFEEPVPGTYRPFFFRP